MSDVIHLDFKKRERKSESAKQSEAYQLYCQANQLDENPDTYEQAKRLYEQAIKLDPNFVDALINLGAIYQRQGDERNAGLMYTMAILQDPKAHVPWYNLGYMFLENQPEIAVIFFRTALALNPKFADAHYNLAFVLDRVGMEKLAKLHWLRFLELEPNSQYAEHAKNRVEQIK